MNHLLPDDHHHLCPHPQGYDVIVLASQAYREELPEGCPPGNAVEVKEGAVVYRFVSSDPPSERDFDSLRALQPGRKVADECMARGLSVFENLEDARRMRLLPALREKSVCKVVLGDGSGKIKQTGQPSHHTLWPYASYPLLDLLEVLAG